MTPSDYRGRFAPSPTGPLHFGSLIAAVGSFADARQQRGRWLVRIDDLDQQRLVPGAAQHILETLEAFGLFWDETPTYQSARSAHYRQALDRLRQTGQTYPCGCSRREVRQHNRLGPEGPIYAGRCRNGLPAGRPARSERLRVHDQPISFADRIQGRFSQCLSAEVGDFVLRRADGFYAYQLAVVVDDAEEGVNQVVRGADLLLSTPRQIDLQQRLGLPTPIYAHLPLALGDDGRKLSKSLAAVPVNAADPLPALIQAWRFLGQSPLAERAMSIGEFWAQAIPLWDIAAVPRQQSQPAPSPHEPDRHSP
jgi:glutamyl-Q tRNA(Asp) synthetase